MLEGDPAPWKFQEYHKKLETWRATVGLAMLAATYRHRDKDAFKSFGEDRVRARDVTGRALIRVAKKKVHVFSSEKDEKYIVEKIKRYPEGNAYIIPPPEKVFENEEKIKALAEGIQSEFYHKYDILLPKEDILYALKRSYEIVKKLAENYKDIAFGRVAPEKIRKHPAYKELLQFLQEFAGVKPKVERPSKVEGKNVQKGGKGEGADEMAVEILSAFKALKYLNYSDEAVENSIREFEGKVEEILESPYPTPAEVYALGLYTLALHYLKRREFEKAEKTFTRL